MHACMWALLKLRFLVEHHMICLAFPDTAACMEAGRAKCRHRGPAGRTGRAPPLPHQRHLPHCRAGRR